MKTFHIFLFFFIGLQFSALSCRSRSGATRPANPGNTVERTEDSSGKQGGGQSPDTSSESAVSERDEEDPVTQGQGQEGEQGDDSDNGSSEASDPISMPDPLVPPVMGSVDDEEQKPDTIPTLEPVLSSEELEESTNESEGSKEESESDDVRDMPTIDPLNEEPPPAPVQNPLEPVDFETGGVSSASSEAEESQGNHQEDPHDISEEDSQDETTDDQVMSLDDFFADKAHPVPVLSEQEEAEMVLQVGGKSLKEGAETFVFTEAQISSLIEDSSGGGAIINYRRAVETHLEGIEEFFNHLRTRLNVVLGSSRKKTTKAQAQSYLELIEGSEGLSAKYEAFKEAFEAQIPHSNMGLVGIGSRQRASMYVFESYYTEDLLRSLAEIYQFEKLHADELGSLASFDTRKDSFKKKPVSGFAEYPDFEERKVVLDQYFNELKRVLVAIRDSDRRDGFLNHSRLGVMANYLFTYETKILNQFKN